MNNLNLIFPERDIQWEVEALAQTISKDYKDKSLVVMGVLNGGFYFTADLTRNLTIDHQLTFVQLSSYGDDKESSGEVQFLKYWDVDIEGRDVLICEDLLDTGLSMQQLLLALEEDKPRSVKIAAFCYKTESKVKPNYWCTVFSKDRWLVGYGMDLDGRKRHLRDIYELIKK